MSLRPLVPALLIPVVAILAWWMFVPGTSPAVTPISAAEPVPRAEAAPVHVVPSERAIAGIEPARTADPVEVARPGPEDPQQPTFPDDYRGLRDQNLLSLYTVFKKSMERDAERLSDPKLSGPDLAFIKEGYLQHSAYVALIQQQRLYHYFYGRRTIDKQVPRNTADVVYHSTGMGEMQITFELRRDEFPDLFATMDEMAKLRESLRSTRQARRSR